MALTGNEIAGLLLANIPIFQEASSHEDADAGVAKNGPGPRYTSRKMEEFYAVLMYEFTMLRMSVEKLVNGLGDLADKEREALKAGDEEAWESDIVVESLEHRLGTGFHPFCAIFDKLHSSLEKIVQLKPADDHIDDSNPKESSSKLYYLRRQLKSGISPDQLKDRIRFTGKEEKRTALIKRITKDNKRLENLLRTSADTQPEPKAPKWDGYTSHLRLRPLMHLLHTTTKGLLPCDCKLPHQARLSLSARPLGGESVPGSVYFDLLLSAIDAEDTEEFCMWLESKICVVLRDQPSQTSSGIVRFAISGPSSTVITPPASPNQHHARTFSGLDDINFTPPRAVPESTLLPLSPSNSNATGVRVDSICETLSNGKTASCCPQLYFDDDACVLYHMKPTRQSTYIEASQPSQSLASLLGGKRDLNLKERRILAVILAHSMLHFCESPWMSREWNKEHITFFRKVRDRKEGADVFDLSRPWLSPSFDENTFVEEDDLSQLYRIHPNPSVLALGIILLEIELNAGIEQYRDAEDAEKLPQNYSSNSNADLFIAQRLVDPESEDHVLDRLTDAYCQAITNCLSCSFVETGAPTSLDNEDFRRSVYANIVRPLEDELWHSFPKLTPEDIGLEAVNGAKNLRM